MDKQKKKVKEFDCRHCNNTGSIWYHSEGEKQYYTTCPNCRWHSDGRGQDLPPELNP